MKLLTLHLQAFGPFTDRVIELGSTGHSLLLIHGPNEAGKSAMLRAISDLRFGIPTQSKDNFVHAHPDMRIGGVFQDRAGRTHAVVRRKGRGHTLLMARPGAPPGGHRPTGAARAGSATDGRADQGRLRADVRPGPRAPAPGGRGAAQGRRRGGRGAVRGQRRRAQHPGHPGAAGPARARVLHARCARQERRHQQGLEDLRRPARPVPQGPGAAGPVGRLVQEARHRGPGPGGAGSPAPAVPGRAAAHQGTARRGAAAAHAGPGRRPAGRAARRTAACAPCQGRPGGRRNRPGRGAAQRQRGRGRSRAPARRPADPGAGRRGAGGRPGHRAPGHAGGVGGRAAPRGRGGPRGPAGAAGRAGGAGPAHRPATAPGRGAAARPGPDGQGGVRRETAPRRAGAAGGGAAPGGDGAAGHGRHRARAAAAAPARGAHRPAQRPGAGGPQRDLAAAAGGPAGRDQGRSAHPGRRAGGHRPARRGGRAARAPPAGCRDRCRPRRRGREPHPPRGHRPSHRPDRQGPGRCHRPARGPAGRRRRAHRAGRAGGTRPPRAGLAAGAGHLHRRHPPTQAWAAGRPLAQAYEDAVRQADRLVDDLARDTARAEKWQASLREIQKLQDDRAALVQEDAQLQQAAAAQAGAWARRLEAAHLPALGPAELREWQARLATARQAIETLHGKHDEHEAAQAAAQALAATLRAAIAANVAATGMAASPAPEAPLRTLAALATEIEEETRQREKTQNTAAGKRQERELQRRQGAVREQELGTELQAAQAALAPVWMRLLLPAEATLAMARARLGEFDALLAAKAWLDAAATRLARAEQALDALARQAQDLAQALAEPPEADVRRLIDRLVARSQAAQATRQARVLAEQALVQATSSQREHEHRAAGHAAELAALCQAAGVELPALLPQAEDRSRRKRQAQAELDQARAQLAQASRHPVPDLRAWLEGQDAAGMDADEDRCTRDGAELEAQLRTAREHEEATRRALQAIYSADTAAAAREGMECAPRWARGSDRAWRTACWPRR